MDPTLFWASLSHTAAKKRVEASLVCGSEMNFQASLTLWLPLWLQLHSAQTMIVVKSFLPPLTVAKISFSSLNYKTQYSCSLISLKPDI